MYVLSTHKIKQLPNNNIYNSNTPLHVHLEPICIMWHVQKSLAVRPCKIDLHDDFSL